MPEKKKKHDLVTTIQHIERHHYRRSVFVIHATLSLAVQVAMWINWYASYAVRGLGVENPFFADRFIISVVLTLFLIGHFVLLRLMESKDRLIITALRQHNQDTFDENVENDQAASLVEENGTDYEDQRSTSLANSKR